MMLTRFFLGKNSENIFAELLRGKLLPIFLYLVFKIA